MAIAERDAFVVLVGLRDRMEKAARDLNHLAGTAGNPEEQDRLFGKEEGVRLAASYLNEEIAAWR
jgi:hypothetical protein